MSVQTTSPTKAQPLPLSLSRTLSMLCCLALSGCGGGGGGGGGGGPKIDFEPKFSEIQANVFTPTCAVSGCHSGGSAAQGLNLSAANSYALLVGVASSEVPSLERVKPGDPDNSYLIQKLEGTAASGARMPLTGAALAPVTIDAIRQWITDGAIDDRVVPPEPIRVTSLSPSPDAEVVTSPTRIIAGFDRDADATTINANTVLLEASGGDGTFGDGNESAITADAITTPVGNPRSASFDLGATVLTDDTYRVTLKGDGGSVILDLAANALDGEYSNRFPSGNGSAGGDFVATFDVVIMAPTLDDIQARVFTPTCSTSGCHEGPTGSVLPEGMDLSNADASFASLVGVGSIQEPSLSRVEATDPDNSYLIQKLEGTAETGRQMPRGSPALDPSVIAVIREWISDGANR